MLELYNDKLIDLLAPHGKEVSFELLCLCCCWLPSTRRFIVMILFATLDFFRL